MDLVNTPELIKHRISEWAKKTKSPYHCINCGKYVGVNHILHPRYKRCKLGSEE